MSKIIRCQATSFLIFPNLPRFLTPPLTSPFMVRLLIKSLFFSLNTSISPLSTTSMAFIKSSASFMTQPVITGWRSLATRWPTTMVSIPSIAGRSRLSSNSSRSTNGNPTPTPPIARNIHNLYGDSPEAPRLTPPSHPPQHQPPTADQKTVTKQHQHHHHHQQQQQQQQEQQIWWLWNRAFSDHQRQRKQQYPQYHKTRLPIVMCHGNRLIAVGPLIIVFQDSSASIRLVPMLYLPYRCTIGAVSPIP